MAAPPAVPSTVLVAVRARGVDPQPATIIATSRMEVMRFIVFLQIKLNKFRMR
jgi:hypothetical protein